MTASAAAVAGAWPVTAARNSSRSIACRTTSALPSRWPCAERRAAARSRRTSRRVGMCVPRSRPRPTRPRRRGRRPRRRGSTVAPAGEPHLRQRGGEALERRLGEGREQRDIRAAGRRLPPERRLGGRSRAGRGCGQQRCHRESRAGHEQRPPGLPPPRRATARGAPQPMRGEQEPFEHAEDPAEHLVGDDPLHERQRGDVDDRVPDADERQRGRRCPRGRPDSEQRERKPARAPAPTPKSAASRPRVASTSATKPPASPPDAKSRVQPADAGVAEVEQVERRARRRARSAPRYERLGASRRRRACACLRVGRSLGFPPRPREMKPVRALGDSSVGRSAGSAARTPSTSAADQRNVRPFTANTTSGLGDREQQPAEGGPGECCRRSRSCSRRRSPQ